MILVNVLDFEFVSVLDFLWVNPFFFSSSFFMIKFVSI